MTENNLQTQNVCPSEENSQYVIEMRNVTKQFGPLIANDNVTLQLKRGEIHALLGENGAGKSTLMSILFGLYQADSGQIFRDGKPVTIKDPNDATALGIGMVHQHFKLVDCFTVLDNIILGAETTTLGFIRKKQARQTVLELSKKYGLYVDPDKKIEDITVGMQQRTEILKMLYRDNEVLIFDEPTAVLTPQEIEELMQIMRNLSNEGKSILFITHKLNEIMAVADRCTILRKGKCVGTVNIKDTTKEELSQMMVGRPVEFAVQKQLSKPTDTVLVVNNLCLEANKKHALNNVSFTVKRGEVVAIAGIDGNGQSELASTLSGLTPATRGQIILNGEEITKASVRYRNTHGISHVPEDRHKHGLILDFPLDHNIVLQRYFEPEFHNHGFIKFNEIRRYSNQLIDEFDIRSSQGSDSSARSMSGGNQQKAIIAREMSRQHDLLLAVQPTRGLDVGAIENIHKQIVNERDNGKAILLISFELDEIMNLADRILVMYEGEIVGEFDPKCVTTQELGLYMAGAKKNNDTKEEVKNEQ